MEALYLSSQTNELNYLLTNDVNILLIDVLLNDCVNWVIGV